MVKQTYHDVAIIRPDVLALGGDGVFHHFQRQKEGPSNLVVFTPGDLDKLNARSRQSNGIKSGLAYLANHQNFPNPKEGGISFGKISDSLDIAVVYGLQSDNDSRGYDPEQLMKKLEDNVNIRSNELPLFMTNNSADRIKLGALGLRVEKPEFLLVDSSIVDSGIVIGNDDLYAKLQSTKDHSVSLGEAIDLLGVNDLHLNQFIKFLGAESKSEYARITGNLFRNRDGSRIIGVQNETVSLLNHHEKSKRMSIGGNTFHNVLGVTPFDMEQYLAFQDGLLNQDVEVFFLCGSQGSGKTLLTYAAAVDQIIWHNKESRELRYGKGKPKGAPYDGMVLLKPNEVLGGKRRDVGALPGNLFQKLKPHLEPYVDAHRETILSGTLPFEEMLRHPKFPNDFFNDPRKKYTVEGGHFNPNLEAIQMTYSGFMRGRSFRNMFVVVDEAQNLEPFEMKTIFERLGPGCKMVVLGDPRQVDNPNCSPQINGLTHAVAHYCGQPNTALINLSRNYRSAASEHARQWNIYN
jgi:hypothetical protein